MQIGEISITNKAQESIIDIDGIIGIPENWQFDNPEDKTSTYDRFRARIGQIKEVSASRVTVNIRSLGGNVNDALLIHDTLAGLKAEITTCCFGYVASAATLIAQAASAGKRLISENSLYLIHRSASCAMGNANEMKATLEALEKTDERIACLYASRSGKEKATFDDLMNENNGEGKWLSAEEAVAAGLADGAVKARSVSNIDTSAIGMLNLPRIPEDRLIPNQENMKIKNTWDAILAFFGFDKDKDNELTEAQVEKLNNRLKSDQERIDALTSGAAEKDAEVQNKAAEIETLNKKIADLQAENARLAAKPTTTEPREDPVHQEDKMPANASAYENDIKNFK